LYTSSKVSLHRTVLGRVAIGGVIVCALLVVQLFLYSPFHRDPAQGRQYCNFFPVEHGNALQACGSIVIAPPTAEQARLPEEHSTVVCGCYPRQQASRAPPA